MGKWAKVRGGHRPSDYWGQGKCGFCYETGHATDQSFLLEAHSGEEQCSGSDVILFEIRKKGKKVCCNDWTDS